MSGLEVVALNLTDGCMSIDSENLHFKQLLPSEINYLIERSHFKKDEKSCFYLAKIQYSEG